MTGCRLFTTIKVLVVLLITDLKLKLHSRPATRKEKAKEFFLKQILLTYLLKFIMLSSNGTEHSKGPQNSSRTSINAMI